MIKPIFKTVFLSVFFFFLLVALGLKYHWVDFLKSSQNSVELALPEQPMPLEPSVAATAKKPAFPLEIIPSKEQPITANMSKEQILETCLQLYRKLGITDKKMIDVIAGDCVVSNYQETIQDVSRQKKTVEQFQKRRSIEQSCFQQLVGDVRLNAIEKQLLWGVCVSDGLSTN